MSDSVVRNPASLPRAFALAVAALSLCFAVPLIDWARFSINNELYSHALLVPVISGFLIWRQRSRLALAPRPRVILVLGVATLFWACSCALLLNLSASWSQQDRLACVIALFVISFLLLAFYALRRTSFHAIAFSLSFLFAMVPLPAVFEKATESFLQRGSAETAYLMFRAAGMTVFRDGTYFQLPGIALEVAPQCSGIHSSLVLFVVALLGGHLFLHSPVKRTVLALAIIPLALARNGFRVFVLGELSVRIGPDIIHSWLHRNGGPVFFILSLAPLAALLAIFMRIERRDEAAAAGRCPKNARRNAPDPVNA